MLTFWGAVVGLTMIGGLPATAGAWAFERRRSRRRNSRGECATCGTQWHEATSGDHYLIHGRLVCEECATKARRRLPWHFAVLGLAVGGVATTVALSAGTLATVALLPVGATVGMTLGAVKLMKLANHGAQGRIATGEFPVMIEGPAADAGT